MRCFLVSCHVNVIIIIAFLLYFFLCKHNTTSILTCCMLLITLFISQLHFRTLDSNIVFFWLLLKFWSTQELLLTTTFLSVQQFTNAYYNTRWIPDRNRNLLWKSCQDVFAVTAPCNTSYQLFRQCLRLVQLSNIYYIYTRTTEVIHSAVNLTSSADRVYSVVFTCVTDTGKLAYRINDNNHLYFSSGQVSQVTRTYCRYFHAESHQCHWQCVHINSYCTQ